MWPPDAKSRPLRKDPDAGKDWKQEEKGIIEDQMVGWHHWVNGHEFEQTLREREGQGSLVCCSPWDCRVRHNWATELNWTEAGWQYTALTYSFPNLEPVCCSMSGSDCCFLTCIQVSQEAGKMVWNSHLFKYFPQLVVTHRIKGLNAVNEAEVDFYFIFKNSFAFL